MKKGKEKTKKVDMTVNEFLSKELPNVADVIWFCNSQQASVYADSTVVKNPEVVFRGSLYSENRLVTEDYLLNFKRSEYDMGSMIGINNYALPSVIGALANNDLKEDEKKLIPLPKYKNVNAPLGSVIRGRRSIRQFSGMPMALEDLATILYYAQGVSGEQEVRKALPDTETFRGKRTIKLRNAPSGGGLYPIDLYIFALNVKDLEMGIYRYVAVRHALRLVRPLDETFDTNQMARFGDIEYQKSNILIGYVYRMYNNSRKYGELGLSIAFIETGEISQNIHLVSSALNYGPCDLGGVMKHAMEKQIGIDGLTEHVIHLTVIGNQV